MDQNNEKTFSEKLEESWKVVEKSRHPQRPYSLDYVMKLFENFEELKGDRLFSEDPAIVAGVGDFVFPNGNKQSVFVVANQKGRKTREKIQRNFGMARPEGYRKAMRVFDLAERFGKPLITLIDTPGAFPGIGAEERGQSVAIGESIKRMFELKIPSVGVVIGEGGSGGALALGVTDHLLMLENSIYSVISPESCAAILWGSSSEMKRAALALKLSARETLELGLCDGMIEEGGEGAHVDFDVACEHLRTRLGKSLTELMGQSSETLRQKRYEKFRKIDARHIAVGDVKAKS
ncbi:MAG: acetyl-CoA carboxylase carboxyltransferase subunit alpha [Bdellovibrionota bacterium]